MLRQTGSYKLSPLPIYFNLVNTKLTVGGEGDLDLKNFGNESHGQKLKPYTF